MTRQGRMAVHTAWAWVLLSVVSTLIAHSATAQVQVDFSPATISLSVGEGAFVDVVVRDVPPPGLAAFQFAVQFTPGLIDVNNPNASTPFAPPAWFLTSTGRSPVGVTTIDNANTAGSTLMLPVTATDPDSDALALEPVSDHGKLSVIHRGLLSWSPKPHNRRFGWITIKIHNKNKYLKVPTSVHSIDSGYD